MKKILILLLSFFLFSKTINALGSKDKDIELTALIGKRIFQSPLNEWLEKNAYKTASEELYADGPILFLKHYEKGYTMMFDINMVLNSLTLYNQSGKYNRFKGKLPFDLRFGMNRDSLYRIIDLRLEEVEENPYILTRQWNRQKLELFFTSKGLNQVNISAVDSLPVADDLGFVRLVSNGLIVSGDCDSLTGKMSWNNATAEYEGEWENNLPHGKGYFKDKNGNWYKGDFKYGYFWGNGILSYANYYKYDGEFLMSRRQGNGICNFIKPKGENYEGEWKQDVMNGLGKYSVNARHYYYGNMQNNKFNGNGKLVTPEGWMEGVFKDGIPNGPMKQYLKLDNTMIEGKWVNGKREGKFTLTNTETKKVSYKLFMNDIEIIDK
ncbi:MAG: hypothetical protein ACKVQB_01505 [Bacteroidia bacterium]